MLDPVTGTAHIQVDFGIPCLFSQFAASDEFLRVTAAQLQGQWQFRCIELQQAMGIPMQQGAGAYHLAIEQGTLAEQAQEIAAVPVSPVHHRGNAKAV
jgi:hypothetical protein